MTDCTYIVEIEVIPSEGAIGGALASSAYANVYVQAGSAEEAEERAQSELAAAGWYTGSMAITSIVEAESFEQGSEGLSYYEQCQRDGLVIVLHTWRRQH